MGEEPSQEIYVGHLLKKKEAAAPADLAGTGDSAVDHQELQTIVNNLVKLPEEAPPPKPAKIARITHNQISAMRTTQSNMPAAIVEQKAKASALIRTFDALMGLFKMPDRRSRCLTDGHECKHCGQIVRSDPAQDNAASRGH